MPAEPSSVFVALTATDVRARTPGIGDVVDVEHFPVLAAPDQATVDVQLVAVVAGDLHFAMFGRAERERSCGNSSRRPAPVPFRRRETRSIGLRAPFAAGAADGPERMPSRRIQRRRQDSWPAGDVGRARTKSPRHYWVAASRQLLRRRSMTGRQLTFAGAMVDAGLGGPQAHGRAGGKEYQREGNWGNRDCYSAAGSRAHRRARPQSRPLAGRLKAARSLAVAPVAARPAAY